MFLSGKWSSDKWTGDKVCVCMYNATTLKLIFVYLWKWLKTWNFKDILRVQPKKYTNSWGIICSEGKTNSVLTRQKGYQRFALSLRETGLLRSDCCVNHEQSKVNWHGNLQMYYSKIITIKSKIIKNKERWEQIRIACQI